jgi:hypothetical protein
MAVEPAATKQTFFMAFATNALAFIFMHQLLQPLLLQLHACDDQIGGERVHHQFIMVMSGSKSPMTSKDNCANSTNS